MFIIKQAVEIHVVEKIFNLTEQISAIKCFNWFCMLVLWMYTSFKQRNTFNKCSFNQNACSFKDCHVNEFITMLMTLKFHWQRQGQISWNISSSWYSIKTIGTAWYLFTINTGTNTYMYSANLKNHLPFHNQHKIIGKIQ